MSCYAGFEPERRVLETGAIYDRRSLRATGINGRVKPLATNAAYLEAEVARRVNTKYAARLKFPADENFDEGSHIDSLLRSPKVAADLGPDED